MNFEDALNIMEKLNDDKNFLNGICHKIGSENYERLIRLISKMLFNDLTNRNFEIIHKFTFKELLEELMTRNDTVESFKVCSSERLDIVRNERGEVITNKDSIINLCNEIKKTIDWDFDLVTSYQKMMNKIDGLVDEIIEEVKISEKEENTETLFNHATCYICGEVYHVNELLFLDNYYYYCEDCNNWRKKNNIPLGEFEGEE